jgi:ketose-bisphosphate aldolase
MALVPMSEILQDARQRNYAAGAFNITELASLSAVIDAAEELQAPVIIQTSASSTVKYYGVPLLADMVRNEAARTQVPVALHLDHCKDLEMVKACVDGGYTSVMIDASSFPFEQNVEMTRQIVEYAAGKDVSVEGELGGVPGVEDDIFLSEEQAFLAGYDESIQFCERTGVDAFAAAIGTAHGLYKGTPKIEVDLFDRICKAVKPCMVIHGGTGLADETFRKLIELGATKVNVSTQMKHTLFESTGAYLEPGPKPDPIKLHKAQRAALTETTRGFMRTFGSDGKA